MGCICSKGTRANEYVQNNRTRKETTKSGKHSVSSCSFRREEAVLQAEGDNDVTASLISNQSIKNNGRSTSVSSDDEDKKKSAKGSHPKVSAILSVAHGEKRAQVISGWPSWLAAVAGEAINGWVPRRADSFEKLDKVGQGTYSSVYKARDLKTNKIVALKKVRFTNMDPESVRFMAREIIILRRLDHPNVMKLEGIITSKMCGSLYLVFEYMEHDLAGLLATPGIKFTEAQIKCYMQQLLHGLEHCHSHGVLHRDIKGSNLLIDHNGNLKIGDFGLANFYRSPRKQPLTSRVVTLWYRPPELLLGATSYEASVDLWSTGCILAELFVGKPILPGRTEVEQLHKIFKLCGSPTEEYWKRSKLPHATIFKPQQPYKRNVADTFKDFPSSALALLDVLLSVDPENRGTANSALRSEFFTTEPLPCNPSSLPKYPPTKEFDVKLRDDNARRWKGHGGNERVHESTKKNSKGSKAVPAPDANAELPVSILKRRGQSNPKSISENFNSEDDDGSSFPIEPQEGAARNEYPHSGQSTHSANFASSNDNEVPRASGQAFSSPKKTEELRTQRSFIQRGSAKLSRFANSVAVVGNSNLDSGSTTATNPYWPEDRYNPRYNNLDDSSHHLLSRQKFLNKEDRQSGFESTKGFFQKKDRMHYSGPLMTAGRNMDEMLKEHEKLIQEAVRKACSDKTNKGYNITEQTESLLDHGRNPK